jgi:hypothetical protein
MLGIIFRRVVACLIFGLVAVAIASWFKIRKAEFATNLKHDMLARGMSAEDIERVLNAGNKPSGIVIKGCSQRNNPAPL